jgi:peptide/nickel transport system substrate-binding protein/oligopeptide transport system substrate-binding protein
VTNTRVTGPAKGANQKLIINWYTFGSPDIATYDAAQAQDSASVPIINLLYDGLVTLDQNLKIENWGADTITPSADGLTYTFHIRPNQKFTDGTPVKASDYAFSLNRAMNPCLASPLGYYLPQANLKDANAFATEACPNGKTVVGSIQTLIGDSIVADDSAATLRLTLSQPTGFFLDTVSSASNAVVEQRALGDGFGANSAWTSNLAKGMGNSGMFEVKSNDKAGHLVLAPNPNWWGVAAGKKLNFTEVDFNMFESTDTLYNTYQSNPHVALSNAIPSGQLAAAKADPATSGFVQTPYLLFQGFAMNYKVKPFDNKDARLAFCEAINRTQVANNFLNGAATPTWHIVPQGMPGYNPNLTGPDGAGLDSNLTLAQNHWNAYKATLNGGPTPPIKISTNLASTTAKALAEFYQATWNQAFGINVTLDQNAWSTILREEQQKTVQLFRFGWGADYPDPQDFLTLLFDTHALYNNQNASVPAADQLMEAADKIFQADQQQQRLADYNQAEKLLLNDGAFCPVYTTPNYYAQRSWVYGMTEDAQGQFPNDAWVTGYLTSSEPTP